MNSSCRRVLGIVTLSTWVAWVFCLAIGGDALDTAERVLRLVAAVLSVSWVILMAVAPIVRTAVVWMEIGRREQQREGCDRCRLEAQHLAAVVPIRTIGTRRVHSDS